MRIDVQPVVLRGNSVYLEPLAEVHADALFAIGVDPLVWRYLLRDPFVSEDDAKQFVAAALTNRAFGGEFPFVIRLCSNDAVIGSTRYREIRPRHRSLEIGYTFVHPSHWWRGAGLESQFLLARHAIEALGAIRVCFMTDARNLWTQRGLERCGVTREGVLRHHLIRRDGVVRDSVVYSIIPEEWPTVKPKVEAVLARFERRTDRRSILHR